MSCVWTIRHTFVQTRWQGIYNACRSFLRLWPLLLRFYEKHVKTEQHSSQAEYDDARETWEQAGGHGPEPKNGALKFKCWDGLSHANFVRHHFIVNFFKSGYCGKSLLKCSSAHVVISSSYRYPMSVTMSF